MRTTRRGFLAGLAAPAMGRGRRPNVLWIMSDEQRPDSLGCYGSRWARTPNLDRLAGEGALFEAACTPSPVCVPARSSLLTGRYGSSLGVLHNQQRLKHGTSFLTWVFEEAGYRTASFGKKHYFVAGRQAFQTEGGSATDRVVDATSYGKGYKIEDYAGIQYPGPQRWILGGLFPERVEETAEWKNVELAKEWLAGLGRGEAFFLRVSLNAPHTPVVAPRQFAGTIQPESIRIGWPAEGEIEQMPLWLRGALRDYQGSHRLSHEQLVAARRWYFERVSFLDQQIGRLLDWMRGRRLLDNTIVAFVSDHGTHLGDHGLLQKQTFYEQVVTVPWLLWRPGEVRARLRLRHPANTLSLLPTLLELAGLETPPGVEAPSLARHLREGIEPAAGPVFSEIKLGYRGYRDDDRLVMVRQGKHKLFLYQEPADPEKFAGREEGALFDLEADPEERVNLFSRAGHGDLVADLRRQIAAWDTERRTEG